MKILVLFIVLLISSCSRQTVEIIQISGPTMGTTYQVKFVYDSALHADINKSALQQEIQDTLQNVNQLMSTYISDSELSLLNKAEAAEPFEIHQETAYVLTEAIRLNQLSEGAFDITVGPLVNLWGFGPEQRPEKVPNQEQIDAARQFVGVDKFLLNGNQVTKLHPSVYIDLSPIAKGHGVDKLAEVLESHNITNYLVDIGGEMRVSGEKPNRQDWRIAIEKPISSERSVQKVIVIGNNAIATSGDYRNYFEEDGVRYSHLIDPSTAKPIQHKLVAVSVIAPMSMTADGLATALIVLGKERGLRIANDNDIPALFIVKQGTEFLEYSSNTFDSIVEVVN